MGPRLLNRGLQADFTGFSLGPSSPVPFVSFLDALFRWPTWRSLFCGSGTL